jgi:hypothetical protein
MKIQMINLSGVVFDIFCVLICLVQAAQRLVPRSAAQPSDEGVWAEPIVQ